MAETARSASSILTPASRYRTRAWVGKSQYRMPLERQFHFADLDRRLRVGVVRDIGHERRTMRIERTLQRFYRIEKQVAHCSAGRRRSRHPDALIDGHALKSGADQSQCQRDVDVAVV